MKPIYFRTLFSLVLFTQLSLAQENSQYFFQFAGAPTVTAVFSGAGASRQSASSTMCTNYLHDLDPVAYLPTSAVPQIVQEQVDGVCEICTGVDLSRIDSCCAQPTSAACFEQFAAQTTPANNIATAAANPVTATAGASTPASTKTSNGNRFDAVSSERPLLQC